MSEDSNLGEKISDSILSIFTKTKIFEKIDKLNFYAATYPRYYCAPGRALTAT